MTVASPLGWIEILPIENSSISSCLICARAVSRSNDPPGLMTTYVLARWRSTSFQFFSFTEFHHRRSNCSMPVAFDHDEFFGGDQAVHPLSMSTRANATKEIGRAHV